jgi:hypothetical protein
MRYATIKIYLKESGSVAEPKKDFDLYKGYYQNVLLNVVNKKALHELQREINTWLESNGLKMKKNWQIYPLDKQPINFVGFLIYRHTTKMRKRNLYKLTRSAKQYKEKPESFVSRYAYVKHMASYDLHPNAQRQG